MREYENYDAMGLAELVRRGDVHPRELLAAARERLERRNPELNAVVLRLFEHAERELADGIPAGPFCGVPFLLKDLGAQLAGTVTTLGSRLYRDAVDAQDSELVRRYRRAGLVIFGKTATPEFGLTTTTESRLHGITRNPWNRERSAGGSSGGSAVAVAAGIVPAAHASDGGGSIRVPASCCGLFGLKPTRGRITAGPRFGEGWAGMGSVHAITRSVRDSAALLDATAGPLAGDPYFAPPPARPYLEEVQTEPGSLRIGLVLTAFSGASTHPDCRAAAEDVAQLCEKLGHEIVPVVVDLQPDPLRLAAAVIVCVHVKEQVDARAAELGRALVPDDVEPGTFASYEWGGRISAAQYVTAVRAMHGFGRTLARTFEQCDVLLTPTQARPPVMHGTLSLSSPDPAGYQEALAASTGYTALMNLTGVPAMSVPLFWNAEGLPIGVQFAAPFGDEATLFRLAAQLERARPWFALRPPLAGA